MQKFNEASIVADLKPAHGAEPEDERPKLPDIGQESDNTAEGARKTGSKSSAFRGVTLFRPTMKWRAQVSVEKTRKSLRMAAYFMPYPPFLGELSQEYSLVEWPNCCFPSNCEIGCLVQISANGKTTSLGDHDTEEQAARAFDRATINKNGTAAKTNFSLTDYKDEIEDLRGEAYSSILDSNNSQYVNRLDECFICLACRLSTMEFPFQGYTSARSRL